MTKLSIIAAVLLVILSALAITYSKQETQVIAVEQPQGAIAPLWQYQCIDTMKTSRDKARAWAKRPNLAAHIDKELIAIKTMGANCVAIATPYDDEFLPYLTTWVTKAREHNLHVWFRGNFSSWEGWFEYPKGMTTQEHLKKTTAFITKNPQLFKDGDIFTASPEAENGGPFNQVEANEYAAFRKYLIDEYTQAKAAFAKINKKVEVNWLSMNGGLAKRMLDKPTVEAIGGVVTIDHYIAKKEQMTEFIEYFAKKFGARVVIGEFGAPIPDINGEMTESEQAEFVRSLLTEMYKRKSTVPAMSYWVLYDSSTALLNEDFSERPAAQELRKYFLPGLVYGNVVDRHGRPIKQAAVTTQDGVAKTITDTKGYYELTLPAGEYTIQFGADKHKGDKRSVTVESQAKQEQNVALIAANPSRLDELRWRIENIRKNRPLLRRDASPTPGN